MSGALAVLAYGALWLGAALSLIGALGFLVMRDPFARLHAASLVGIVAPLGAAIAGLHAFPDAFSAAKLVAFLAIALAATGIGTHATARALHLRRTLEERIGEERRLGAREAKR